ncbi:hypothetical protein OYC64_005122 [Pagothenia borchgrevinki]|uniref:Pro-opiomelanocortin/corticotropin ACTH central region domain-containing protein n=1 Tax=Pagothenia borchgrevinki TaxID=8213 RepID=A0ABD2GF69_PAGBO
MVCLCWLFVVVMAYVCVPGFGSKCWESSICNDLSSKGRILDCIHLCMSVIQTELPLSPLALKVNYDDDLLLSIILATLVSEDKIPGSYLKDHSDERRSYSMEHFRWGKPTGRKRRPVKVFASSLEGGGSSGGSFPRHVRRDLSGNEDEMRGQLNGGGQIQVLPKARVSPESQALGPQERKDGTYRMSHFRWGSPTSKRNGSLKKQWGGKSRRQLTKLFKNIMVKDVQRIMG